MDSKINILNTKLRFSGSTDTIIRKRFKSIHKDMIKKRLTTVIAGAGYGKSTLIHQALEPTGLPSIWYRLDRYDKDLETFLFYLITGMRRYYFRFGERTLSAMEHYSDLNSDYKRVITVLLNELDECVEDHAFIVLDDYHTVFDSNQIRQAIDFIIENLQNRIHLIIISRIDPGLQLSIYVARREVLEIRDRDLAFSFSETKQLYSQIFNLELKDQTLESIRQKSGGWVSALILFFHVLNVKKSKEIESFLIGLEGSNQVISKYIEENVYNCLSDETKNFLIKTSILNRIDVDFCNRFLNIDNSMTILKNLEEKHLFTYPMDEERQTFCYHQLFIEFLQDKFRQTFGQEKICTLHGEAARLMETMCCDEDALRHYLAANQVENACILLSKISTILWSKGIQIIYSNISNIPDVYWLDSPWVIYLQALCAEYSGRHIDAIELFETAYAAFQDADSVTGVQLCLGALGHNYLHSGYLIKAETALTTLTTQFSNNPELAVSSLVFLIESSISLGKKEEADRLFHKALSLSLDIRDRRRRCSHRAFIYFIRGLYLVYTGDFKQAINTAQKVKNEISDFNLDAQMAHYHFLTSFACYFDGQFSDGLVHAGKGIELLRKKRFESYLDNSCSDYAWLLWAYGANSLNLGNINDALSYCEESLALFNKTGSRSAQGTLNFMLAMIHKLTGDPVSEHKHIDLCKRAIDGLSLPIPEGLINGFMATKLLENGQPNEALPLIQSAHRNLKHSTFETARIAFLYARYHWLQGNKDTSFINAVDALRAFDKNQYDFWLIMEFPWIEPLLVEIYTHGIMTHYLEKIFTWLGNPALDKFKRSATHSLPSQSQLAGESAPPLKVCCLGKFRVFCGDEEIPPARWKSRKKAKDLFKYLVATKERGYQPKDVFMELLWPEEDPEKTVNRFHVTLSALRKILEPELTKGKRSSYILSDEDSYLINLGEGGSVDTDTFLKELELAETHKDNTQTMMGHILNAENIYQGDFLEEDIYNEWCIRKRDSYRDRYLSLLEQIITFFENAHDTEKCIRYANTYLEFDPYSEKIYQALMSYYSSIGNMAMVVLTYEKCKDAIEKDLECPLSKEIKQFFDELVSV